MQQNTKIEYKKREVQGIKYNNNGLGKKYKIIYLDLCVNHGCIAFSLFIDVIDVLHLST